MRRRSSPQAPRGSDGGAAAVDFALVLPFLLLLLFGIIDFRRACNAQIALSHSEREAARVWALGGTAAEAQTAAQAAAAGLSGVTATTSTCTFGAATTITVSAEFSYITPFIADLAPGLTSLSTDGVMRCGG